MDQKSHRKVSSKGTHEDALYEYAMDIANAQLDRLESYMKAHPESYPNYATGLARLAAVEAQANGKIKLTRKLMDEIMDAHCEVCVAFALEMYLRGVLDGGRVYHAFVCRELPKRE